MKLEAFQQNFAEDQHNQLVYFSSLGFLRCSSRSLFSNMVGFIHLLFNKSGKGVAALLLVTDVCSFPLLVSVKLLIVPLRSVSLFWIKWFLSINWDPAIVFFASHPPFPALLKSFGSRASNYGSSTVICFLKITLSAYSTFKLRVFLYPPKAPHAVRHHQT